MIVKNLTDKEWKQFRIGELFDISRPNARNKDNYSDGDVPFVASGASNNGVMKCCIPLKNEKLDSGNCITVSPVDGSTFYHIYNFLGRGGAGSSVLMLYSKKNRLDSGIFTAKMINQTCSKYTYGHMGNKDSIKREIIMLPITEAKSPDSEYMSDYIKDKKEKMLLRYKKYVEENIIKLKYKKIMSLNEVKWESFNVSYVFDEIERGKRIKKAKQIKGLVPYVSSTSLNNGVDGFIEASIGTRIFSDCISLANSGSVGVAFYEPFKFVASDHVTHLKCKKLNRWHYLFLSCVIEKQKANFNFNREINDSRIRKMKIMLPVSSDGLPDYKYMEQYAMNMMKRKYEQYIEYIKTNYKII